MFNSFTELTSGYENLPAKALYYNESLLNIIEEWNVLLIYAGGSLVLGTVILFLLFQIPLLKSYYIEQILHGISGMSIWLIVIYITNVLYLFSTEWFMFLIFAFTLIFYCYDSIKLKILNKL